MNRDPDQFLGQCFTLVFSITQFDQGTGPCSFRAYFDTTPREYNFDYLGENALVEFGDPLPRAEPHRRRRRRPGAGHLPRRAPVRHDHRRQCHRRRPSPPPAHPSCCRTTDPSACRDGTRELQPAASRSCSLGSPDDRLTSRTAQGSLGAGGQSGVPPPAAWMAVRSVVLPTSTASRGFEASVANATPTRPASRSTSTARSRAPSPSSLVDHLVDPGDDPRGYSRRTG
ncbi:MAG: hypothetical protein U5R31_00610 [Acidimicrobiia bacterium]|nr:hypothetical protein [Acidimicrobiia bacterium]